MGAWVPATLTSSRADTRWDLPDGCRRESPAASLWDRQVASTLVHLCPLTFSGSPVTVATPEAGISPRWHHPPQGTARSPAATQGEDRQEYCTDEKTKAQTEGAGGGAGWREPNLLGSGTQGEPNAQLVLELSPCFEGMNPPDSDESC